MSRRRHIILIKRAASAEESPSIWFKVISTREFGSFSELRRVFGSVDKVGKITVFYIGGNKFRLIAAIHRNRKKVYIRHMLTHAEYDPEKRKK